MKQKLIMENWRRFLKENKSLTIEELSEALDALPLNENQLDEGVLSTIVGIGGLLAALMSPSSPQAGDHKGIELTGENNQEYQLTYEEVEEVSSKLKTMAQNSQGTEYEKPVADGVDDLVNTLQKIKQDKEKYGKDGDSDGDGFIDKTMTGPLVVRAPALEIAIQQVKGVPSAGDTGTPSRINRGDTDLTDPEKKAAQAKMKGIS
jgi:hypothetical protein